ncbi:MAG: hypothetical protein ACLR3C_00285 [Eggerthella lenta]
MRHLAVGDERLAEQPVADELRNAILSGSHGGTQQPASAPSSLAEAVARHNAGRRRVARVRCRRRGGASCVCPRPTSW